MNVVSGIADEPPLEEGDVDDGRVEIDALKDEHLEGEVVVKVGLRAVHFWKDVNFLYIIQTHLGIEYIRWQEKDLAINYLKQGGH